MKIALIEVALNQGLIVSHIAISGTFECNVTKKAIFGTF